MSIGATIKKLRRDKNITQEQLAEMLGISTNAVSQWECDKTAPDISHLPVLANIFEVSADVLLEIDIAKSKKQSEVKEFTTKYAELHSQGKTEERLNLCRAMQKKYPNDETVLFSIEFIQSFSIFVLPFNPAICTASQSKHGRRAGRSKGYRNI